MRVLYLEYNGKQRLTEVDDVFFQYGETDEFLGLVLARDGVMFAICTNQEIENDTNIKEKMSNSLYRGYLDLSDSEDYIFEILVDFDYEEDE